jgi:hypothetical protein
MTATSITTFDADSLPFEMLVILSPAAPTSCSQLANVRCFPPQFIIIMSDMTCILLGGFDMTSSMMSSLLSSAMAAAIPARIFVLVSSP